MYVSRNTEALSCNHCCSGKSTSNTYSECACVVLGIQDVISMRHKVICGLLDSTVFFHIIAWTARLSKKVIELKICVLIFSATFVWNISLLKMNWARYCRDVRRNSCKLPFILFGSFMKFEIFSTYFRKIVRYRISWKSVPWQASFSMRTDRQWQASSRFSQFSGRSKIFNSCLTENTLQRTACWRC